MGGSISTQKLALLKKRNSEMGSEGEIILCQEDFMSKSFDAFEDEIIFCQEDFMSKSFDAFEDMRRKEELVDFKINLENCSVIGHRLVLAARIPHFRKIFCSDEAEVPLAEVDPDVLESVIDFAYSGKIKITPGNVVSLISVSKVLQLLQVYDACWEFVKRRLSSHNVLEFRKLAEDHGCTTFLEAADNYMKRNFEEFSNSESFVDLSFQQFKQIISRDDIKVSTEEKVFEAVIRWIKGYESERRDLLPELLSAVRMYFLTPDYLITRVSAEELVRSSLLCRDLVDEAKSYHLLPDEKSKFCRLQSQPRIYEKKAVSSVLSSQSLIFEKKAVSSVPSSQPLIYEKKAVSFVLSSQSRVCKKKGVSSVLSSQPRIHEKKAVSSVLSSQPRIHEKKGVSSVLSSQPRIHEKKGVSPPVSSQRRFYGKKAVSLPLLFQRGQCNDLFADEEMHHLFADVAPRRSLIYSVYGNDGVICVKQFDHEGDRWLYVSSSKTFVQPESVVCLGEVIYIFGNPFLYTLELSTKKWSSFHCKVIRGSGSVVYKGKIYFFGGNCPSGTVQYFDVKQKIFLEECPMRRLLLWPGVALVSSSKGYSSTSETFIYVTGGGIREDAVYNDVDRYNPETKEWSNVPSMFYKRFMHGCCHLKGKIYVCGGITVNLKKLSSAEMFDPLTNQWIFIRSMTEEICSLSVTPHGDKLYAWGKRPFISMLHDRLEIYDPVRNRWEIHACIRPAERRTHDQIFLVKSYDAQS